MSLRRYLIDTHILIWAMEGDSRLSPKYRSIVADGSSLYVSIVTLWEMAIKRSLGKLDIKLEVLAALAEYDIEILPLKTMHIGVIEHLPHHHRDPFDRMLIAQAMREKLDMLTADRNFSLYDITIA